MPCGFSEVFWSFVITSGSALCLALTRWLYKSKCKTIKCCGCKIERDTEAEKEEDEMEMQMRNKESNKDATNNV